MLVIKMYAISLACFYVLLDAAKIQSVYPSRGSTEGGTYLVISGSGFMMPVEANPWDSQVVFVGAKACHILAHYTSSTQIVCETSPHDFTAESSGSLTVSVQMFGGLGLASYTSLSSAFQYNWYDTPMIHWSDGWGGTGGDVVQFAGDVYPGASVAGQFDIRIGDARCGVDEEAMPLTHNRRRSLKQVRCTLPDDEMLLPGYYNVTIRVGSIDRENGNCPNALCFPELPEQVTDQALQQYGLGLAAIVLPLSVDNIGKLHRVWGGSMDIKTGDLYHFTVYPQVDSIEPSEGGSFGGNNLTLHGTSFAVQPEANEVTVGGKTCTVLEASVDKLVCRLSADEAASAHSMRGLLNSIYARDNNSRRRRVWAISSVPAVEDRFLLSKSFLKGDLNTIGEGGPYDFDTLADQAMRELTGYFVPPLSTSYTFYISGDDRVTLELGETQGTPNETLRIICSYDSWVSSGDYAKVNPQIWFYGEDLSTLPDLTGPTKKVSEPVFLSAGMRYPFRLRNLGYGGYNWFRTAMKVGGLSSATLASGEMLADSQVRGMTAVMPSMEVQAIRLKATGVLREIHWIEIADVTQPSTFRIRMTGQVGQEATMSFANSVDPGTVRDGVRDANVIIAGEEPYRLHNCRSMSVDVNETAPARRFTLTFECPLEAGTSRWIGLDLIDPGLGSATVGTLQTATAPLAGSFMVGHSGTWSSAIEARTATTSWTHLTQEVQNIRRPEGDANGQLELECFRHPQGWSSGEQFQVLVRFRRPLGNVPLLEVNTTGLRGTGFSLEVYPVEDGDADAIFLDRIPADLFEVPDPADPDVQPVRVVVNGVVGALGGNTLGYRYNTSLVPVLVSVSPSMVDANGTLSLVVGNILAYTNGVSNWTQDLMVQLGEDAGQCQDFQEVSSSGSNVEVTCVLANARAGLHAVNLISLSQGQADPSLAPEVSVEAVLDEVGPLTGSLAGGTVLTLVGVGLRGMNCSQLLVGGVPCTEPAASNIPVPGDVALACLTPALSSFDASSDPANWARTSAADVTLAQPASTASVVRASFQYASGSTPLLSDVVPSFYSSALSTTIVINGSGLASAAGASEAPVVQFGERMGSVTTQEDIGLHVWLLRAAPTPPDQDVVVPLAWIPGKGFAAVPSGVTFESRFEVTAISPVSGSKAGGILVTITGAGFHSDATKHTVKFDLSGGLSRDCAVISGTTSELTCRLQGGASMENMGPSASDSEHDHGMRRLSAERERREKLRCEAGADDHSKVRCFALAMSPGSIRSLSSDTEGGRSKDALDWIRRSELEGGQRPMVEPVYNIEDSSFEDDLISGPETADGEPARRLELEDDVDLAPARSEAFQGLRRWGVDSDEAEEFRLRRLGPARPREKEAKRFVEADAEDTDEIRRLSGDMDGDMDNETDSSNATDSDPAVPEILTLAMSLNGVRPTCKASFCGLNLTDEATPTVSAVLPLKGSYADGTDVVLTVSSMKEPEQVQVYFGETECPNAVVSGAMGDWRVTVPLCSFEASKVPVHLLTSSGYAAKASPFTGASFHFEQELRLTSVTPSSGSFYGGTLATIAGAGLGATTAANYATVGGTPCQVTAASNDQISCYVPPAAAELATGDVAARTMEAAVKVLSASVATEPGLKGEYFFFTQGSTLPSLDGRVPDLTRTDSTINFADTSQVWDANLPSSTHFAVRWTGYITVQSSGDYTFYLGSDDGSQLFLDGSLVVDNDGTHGFRTRTSVPQTLAAHSMHMVTVLFFQTIGSHGVRLQYLGPDTGGQVLLVPSSVLSHGSFEQAPTLSYVYDSPDSAPFIENLTEAGATLTLEGANFGADGKVALGSATNPDLNFLCTVTSWSATNIICSRPELPSGAWQVRVHTAMGWSNVAPLLVWVELTVTSVEANGVNVSAASATSPWVLVMKFSEGGLLGYDSELWSNAELLNPDSPEDMPGNAKYQAYMDTPFKRLRACVGTAYGSCVSHSFDSAYSSASALFTAGYVRDFSVDQGGLIQALGAKPGTYQACPMLSPGFNLECDSANKARWGFCANCPNQQCQPEGGDADAAVGIGLRGSNSPAVGAGWTAYFASGGGTCSATSETHKDVWLWVENLTVTETTETLHSGHGGGVAVTIAGSGLGFDKAQTKISVCGEPCEVSKSDGSSATCAAPGIRTMELIDTYPEAFPSTDLAAAAAMFYTDRGELESSLSELAFKSSVDLQIDLSLGLGPRSGCWLGFELPPGKEALVTAVDFFPPTDPNRRAKAAETVFEVRSFSGNVTWTEIASARSATTTGASIAQGWTSYPVQGPEGENSSVVAQAFRVRVLPDACNSAGELMRGVRFRGILLSTGNASACPIEVEAVSHPLASATGGSARLPVTLSYSLARTPVVTALTPSRGTARGDTLVTLLGEGLDPLDANGDAATVAADNANIMLNGYSCLPQEANSSALSCMTTERNAGIQAPSTEVFLAGRGYAIISERSEDTVFKYVDRWSNIYSWLDSEPPVDGDSVIVPEGQAIMLDVNSPKLFLLLIMGYFEFDRKDLSLDSTYIWIAGGHFFVGSEEAPFLQQATITLHGDRWNTIELPVIGSKMLVVTDLGGLGTCTHQHEMTVRLSARGRHYVDPCPVKLVGRLELHGKPSISWTRLVETAAAGTSLLRLEEAVDWEVGTEMVITPSERGEEEEVRKVQSLADGGLTIELDQPLRFEHLGIWYFNDELPSPTDLRAAVGRLTRNVKVQGDEKSLNAGNSFLFGVHMGAFHGGIMRVENTELTRSGQAANFGRYSSHWHHLSPHRTVDVVDVAYLRNNSYHHTFQRAVVVHSTDYAQVLHNVALQTKGHSYFTEAGDEVFVHMFHNLAVHPLQHPLLLMDDMTPAGFWLPGFQGWHRDNMAANCHRGWRLQKIEGIAGQQTDLTFFNNSVHASGFGWHLKPPHAPPTLNNFLAFTAFRCSTGMFYYGTGNIFHDDHRFVECGTGHFMNHLSNGLHTAPLYHNLILVGNIDPQATNTRSGIGIRAAKDNEYFFVSGLTVVNYRESAVLQGCFETTCTMRFERIRWFNSTRRTVSSTAQAGIFWDMDGTLTGNPNGFVAKNFAYNHFPDCQVVPEHVDGVQCGRSDGSLRMRRLLVDSAEPWQLDGKLMRVVTSAGEGDVPYDFFKLGGWPVVVVENETFDMKVEDPNDFQKLRLWYSFRNYIMEKHGYQYTITEPQSEYVQIHLNFTDWRNHWDATTGLRLSRMPTRDDPFGSHSMMLWQDQCDAFNLTEEAQETCGVYVNETGLLLKAEIDEQPEVDMVHGRLTTALTMKVVNNSGTFSAGPNTPSSGNFMQTFTPRECPVAGCPQPAKGPDGYNLLRRWSDASGWPDGQLPGEMDNVVLPPEDNVLLDIVTPKLHWLDVQGRLEFDREKNTTLNAHSVKVWGKMEMGTAADPIPPNVKAEVVLWGDEQSITVIMTEGLFLVNKVVAVLGSLSAVGSPSTTSQAWTRLVSTADTGATQLIVRGNQEDWPLGAQVAISATEYPQPPATTETEVRKIASPPVYDVESDSTTLMLDVALVHRHFAGTVDSSSDTHWPQPTLAAAVALLEGRSNVIFRTGEEVTEHGGEVVIAGSADGNWEGVANISNVDFLKMGKHWYQAPALKFNFLAGQTNLSRVENCVFSQSQSGAIEANSVSNLEIIGNVFHRTFRTAIWIRDTSADDVVIIRKNIAIETLRHSRENTDWVRHFGAFYMEVRPGELSGNVAAGSCDTGFILRPQLAECQKGDVGKPRLQQDELNEAVATLVGVFILDACKEECNECAQIHGLVAWKSAHGGILSGDQNSNVRLDTILLADNHIGVGLRFVRSSPDMSHRIYSYNMSVFGSTPASTCDASIDCRALGREDVVGETCNSVIGNSFRRVGIMTHMINNLPKLCEMGKLKVCRPPTTPVKLCVMPWEHRLGSAGSRYSEAHWDAITFGHWSASDCGRPSAAFTYNPTNIDTAYPQLFSSVKWLPSVEAAAKVFLGESRATGNRVSMSPDFDGTSQMALTDVDGTLLGTTSADASLVTVYNPALALQTCQEQGSSFYDCPDLQLRYLTWEAVGGPAHRVLSKMKLWRASDDRSTWSAGPQPELGCIPADADKDRNFKVRPNEEYNLTMFTSPPKHHRLFWFNDNPEEKIRLDIFLSQPFRLEVYVDGGLLSEDVYDTAKEATPRLPELTDPHGSYTFDPHQRRFYLVMAGGTFSGRNATLGAGFILLRLLQVVQISMTVSVSLAEFDGPAIVANIATLLQIDRSRIKIVSVQSKAQVAAQQGRLLQSRSLQSGEEVALIFQVVEENPEPVPGEAFSGAGVPPPAGTTWEAVVVSNSNTTGNVSGSGSYEYSAEGLAELASLVQILQNASDSGTLAAALQVPVTLDSIELTDSTQPVAEEPEVPEDSDNTTTSMTETTTTAATIGEVPPQDEGAALLQSIGIGAAVGVGVGVLMMGVGYLVRRRFYSNSVHTPYDEASSLYDP